MEGNRQRLNYQSALLLKTAIDSGIESPRELANIMGNAHVETGGFSRMHENFRYRSAAAIVAVVKSADDRFTMQEIEDAVASKDPRRVATIMYERRADLGNLEPGDGWKFHGRGYFQYTGRHNYTEYGRKFGVDLARSPDIAADPQMAANLAIAYWQDRVPQSKREDVVAAAYIINGGDNGKRQRILQSERWAQLVSPELIADFRSGHITPAQFGSHNPAAVSASKELGKQGAVSSLQASNPMHSLLKLGNRSESVRTLQNELDKLGYTDARGHSLRVDGDFGSHTEEAVKAFQSAHGLHVDGAVGPDTRAALQRATHSPLLSERTHPDHGLFCEAREGIRNAASGEILTRSQVDSAAATLVVKARQTGMNHIDLVMLNTRGDGFIAVQGDLNDPAKRWTFVDWREAAARPIEHSTRELSKTAENQQHAEQVHVQAQHIEYRSGLTPGIRP